MKCVNCKSEVGELKKHHHLVCKCGAKLMCIQIKKELILVDLRIDKGENRCQIK